MKRFTFGLIVSLFAGSTMAGSLSQACLEAKHEVAKLESIINKGGLHPYHAMQADQDLLAEQQKVKSLCDPTVYIPQPIIHPSGNSGSALPWGSPIHDDHTSTSSMKRGCLEAKYELLKTEDDFRKAMARGGLLSYHIDEAESEIENLKMRVQQECEGRGAHSSPSRPSSVPVHHPILSYTPSFYGSGSARPWGSALHDQDDDFPVTPAKKGGCAGAREELAQTEATYRRQQSSMLSYQIEEAEDDIERLKARVRSECGSRLRMLVVKSKEKLEKALNKALSAVQALKDQGASEKKIERSQKVVDHLQGALDRLAKKSTEGSNI